MTHQGGRNSATLEAVSSPLADNINTSEPSGTAAGDENREAQLPTLVLITVAHPKGGENKNGQDENGEKKTDLKPTELKGPPNDQKHLLARYRYPNKGNQRVFICADHPHELKNSKNTSVRDANKSDIVACLVEAVSIGGPVVIYYSGHGGRKAATLNNGLGEYNEDATKAHKAKEGGVKDAELAYIVSGDCQEIWGKEVGAALLKGLGRNGGRKTTIFLSFDTCHIATFFDPFFAFPCVYRAEDLGGVTEELVGETKFGQNQIIFLASTQLDQEAHTLLKGERMQDHGAVTWFTTWFLPALEPGKKAKDLVNRLCGMCHSKGQTPQIRSLRPIVDLEIELLHG